MRRAYKFLLRPTVKQAQALTECVENHRVLYNAALEERREAWRRRRASIGYGDQSAQLKAIRGSDVDGQGRWSFSSQQATLRRLDKAMRAFHLRVKAGQRPGYPRFKNVGRFDSVEWPKDRDGCRWNSTPGSGQVRIYLQGVGHVRVHAHREVGGRVKTISVKREGSRWYVVLSCDSTSAQPMPATGLEVGIDMGVASFLTTSDGATVPNPRYLVAAADKLSAAHRALAGCERHSRRRGKARERIARIHRTIKRQRLDHIHKSALGLIGRYDLIAHEALRIADMTRSARGTAERPGTKVSQKTGLNRSILDASWGMFLSVLAAKAESAGRAIIAVDPRNTSRACYACGHRAKENRVSQAEFKCVACGHTAHADVNAAQNILRAGLALREAAQAA